MTRSLLSRLPDIFARAAVRSSDALYALGLRPGQYVNESAAISEAGVAPRWQGYPSSDMSALLSLLAGQAPFPLLRNRLGLLWLSTLSHDSGCQGPNDDEAKSQRDASRLSDFAQRLLMARELLSHSAMVVVDNTEGLEEEVSLVMQTAFGQCPRWTKFKERAGAPWVLMCKVNAPHNAAAPCLGHQTNQRIELIQSLRDAPMGNHTALALGPSLDLGDMWRAWPGRWVVTHADPRVLQQLQRQAGDLGNA